MLNNNSKKDKDADAIANSCPDPWLIPRTTQKQKIMSEAWRLPKEPYPLINPAGNPKTPRLIAHQSTSEEILLKDELNLKNIADSQIKQQLKKALALLYWLKTIKQPNSHWQISSL